MSFFDHANTDDALTKALQRERYVKSFENGICYYECLYCEFKTKIEHIIILHGSTIHNFKCMECNEEYISKENLVDHIQLFHKHIYESFQCVKCDFKCSISSDLDNHNATNHLDVKEHKCTSCEFICSNLDELLAHNELGHRKLYNCHLCVKKYYYRKELLKHIKLVHKNFERLKCFKCDYLCSSKGKLLKHYAKTHSS